MKVRNIGFSITWLALIVCGIEAKEWRGIVPLSSTRLDFEKMFGHGIEQYTGTFDYELRNENISVKYSAGRCDESSGSEWDVKEGTVLHLVVRPKKSKYLSDIATAELEQFNVFPGDRDLPNTFYYLDEKNGAAMWVDANVKRGKRVATTFFYFPTFADRNKKCRKSK